MIVYTSLFAMIFVGGLLVSVLAQIRKKRRSKFHTVRSLLIHYFINRFVYLLGAKARRRLEKDTKSFPQVQETFLLNILRKNSKTNYGREFKFQEIRSCRDFTDVHPITKYDHYKPFVDEIYRGKTNVLTNQDPWMLAVTSGTTGRSCLIPKTRNNSRVFVEYGFSVGLYHTLFNVLPLADSLQKSLKLFHAPQVRCSEGGIPIGPSTLAPSLQLHALSTPRVHLDVPSEPAGLYIHVLFALRDRDLGAILGNFAFWIHGVFVFLERNWKLLVQDLEKGEINMDLDITDGVRKELNKLLKPDKQRANELRVEFQKGFDGIARRIWPHLAYVHGVVSGSSELYATQLRERYLKGVALCSTIYGATEGLIGVNLWPLNSELCYLLVPRSMFFEFIPLEHTHEEQPKTLFGDEIEPGCLYELVVTTLSGLYRYRIGDVVKVVRFYNNCPVVEFQYRQGQLLNMRSEKTTETMMYEAITNVLRGKGEKFNLVDYTCAESILLDFIPTKMDFVKENIGQGKNNNHRCKADFDDVKPFYIIFLEFSATRDPGENRPLSQELDHALCEVNPFYLIRRENGGCIDRLKVCLVQPGTFKKFRDFLLKVTPTAVNQLKIPRKLTSKEQLMFFCENSGHRARLNN